MIKIERRTESLFEDTPIDIEGNGLIYSFNLTLPTKRGAIKKEKKIFNRFKKNYKSLVEKREKEDREYRFKFLIYLTHFIHKKGLSALDEKEITIYAEKHKSNLLTYGTENYEIKKGNMYYVFSYTFGNMVSSFKHGYLSIENDYIDAQNRSHDYNRCFDLSKADSIISWYEWQFQNNINFKINTQYDIHKGLEFLDQNKKYFDSEYNNYDGVSEIRQNMNKIKNNLKELIDDYYSQLIKNYDHIVSSVRDEMNEFSADIIKENTVQETIKKHQIQKELIKQNKNFSFIEQDS